MWNKLFSPKIARATYIAKSTASLASYPGPTARAVGPGYEATASCETLDVLYLESLFLLALPIS